MLRADSENTRVMHSIQLAGVSQWLHVNSCADADGIDGKYLRNHASPILRMIREV